jgi:predicted patatin/cPLA2 family phospholipase
MKTGLVLEGGAMRGLFSAGVTDVFMEEGIAFDGAIGVSAGAALVLRPKEALPVSRTEHDPEKLRAAYRMGQECARENLDRIHAFLAAAGDR